MKKGFTLIELLAVLVVLGLILSITIPTVVNMMIKAKKDTLNLSADRIEYAVNTYLEEYAINHSGGSIGSFRINISNNKIENNTITIKGKIPKSGTIDVKSNGNIYMVLYNDGYCSYKGPTDSTANIVKMAEEDCTNRLIDDKKIFIESDLVNIEVNQNYNLLDNVYFKSLEGEVINNEITYTSTPTFDSSVSGTYNIKYSTTYEGVTYTATRTIRVNEIEYTIRYNLNGGTANNKESYNIKSEEITLVPPTKAGYDFEGWSGTGLSGIVEIVKIPTGSTGTREYTAHYTTLPYIITCYLDGTNTNTIIYNIETETFTLNNPTLSGSEFTGWSTIDNTNARLKPVTIVKGTTGNKVFYAHFENRIFVLNVYLDGGTWSGTSPQSILSGESATIPYPTKTDNVFAGWSKTGNGSTISGTNFIMGNQDSTLTANWYTYSDMYTYTTANASEVINDGSGNWRIKFKADGIFKPLVDMDIDVFLVGGGGGSSGTNPGGGGGGYTTTQMSISLSANQEYSIVVGLGGSPGITGGTSTAFGYSALGGKGTTTYNGGAGGSGGGCGAHSSNCGGCNGGTNGGNGGSNCGSGGAGQGTSIGTREFGESTGTLYSGGGGGSGTCCFSGSGGALGGGGAGVAGTVNTGGGGGASKSGGSGIVIIRNHR